ncbi:MAG: biotin/lipoate--protein ligase family protein, partial [Fimbriimonadaceae bacterium]|nr:biotin/lipoate--protein ligase family protein [Alphaproteobacteria bacterium]
VAMVAFGDAFGVLAPPEVGVMYRWPGMLRINGGRIGDVRLAVSAGRDGNGCPDWMVLDIGVQMAGDARNRNPGENPDETNFYEEGCVEITRTALIESYSRHFLTWLHTWNEDGFGPVHQAWMERAEDRNRDTSLNYQADNLTGTFIGLDDAGDMLIRIGIETRLLNLETALGIGVRDGT